MWSVTLYANIGPRMKPRVPEYRWTRGIFRSEFLFLNAGPPDMEGGTAVLKRWLLLNPHPVFIRKMDQGGDKIPLFTARNDQAFSTGLRGLANS
jgi:phosphoenolpyruvate-protein kinase (PTS system EI component)